jgi:hypothetical protein
MMRCLVALISCLLFLIWSAAPSLAQVGFDRKGSDYTSFPVRSGDPAVCAMRCEREVRCRAWSFLYPSSDHGATCWLKNLVPARVEDACCVSGVKGAAVIAPRSGRIEFSIDRYGGDYRHFETSPDPKGKPCAEACEADTRCRAWTYRRPGYGAPVARCFLKDQIKPPRRRPCCISGVVR